MFLTAGVFAALGRAMEVTVGQQDGHRTEALQILMEASQLLQATSSRVKILPGILNLISKVLAADAYVVWRTFDEQRVWRMIAVRGLSHKYRARFSALRSNLPTELLAVEDVGREHVRARFENVFAEEGIRSLLAVPISLQNQERAAIVFGYRQRHSFSALETDYATVLANVCAAALNANELNRLHQQERRRLLQAEKSAAAGRMAATVVHEVNNPLEAITNLIFLAREHADQPEQVRDYLQLAESEVVRVSQIAHKTLSFYRENASAASVNPSDLAEHTLRIYGPKCRDAKISVERSFKSTRSVMLRPGEILQVTSNMVANAIHAMPSGGALRISTTDVQMSSGPGVLIEVRDTGTGISPRHVPHIFDAFFSARPGSGTGIGLFVARQIVLGYGGRIEVASSIQPATHGTTMSIYLPLRNRYSADRAA